MINTDFNTLQQQVGAEDALKLTLLKDELADRVQAAVFNLFNQYLSAVGHEEKRRVLDKAGVAAIFGSLHVHNVLNQRSISEVRAYLEHVRVLYGTDLPTGSKQGLDLVIGYVEGYLR